ncbi:hypothetical protein FisN_25Lh118 [Fistulifera solaris]|uniref:Uncharacterized protein n=1 Tax=Fistulifera solaris TaxID=1519565 RepID=A0A1Z5J7R0_FISSO|nr:hypothetical protein FisN_25Lh118 [Fistulifera solaris]|eukprot:GAX10033.1 hypothetical protein FisN_25Lh118 [Fistulifera solaris]
MSEQREDVPTIAIEPAKPMAYSTSTLLNEISMLRNKLKELEDDSRSTVSSVFDIDAAASIMRKELYRIEQEKADQEKHFMNQIASMAAENGAALEALRIKLKESEDKNHELHAKIAELEDQDKSKDYMELLEEECKQHALELEKMQQNIVQADIEVMEIRREMDALHEKLVETVVEKESLQHELTQLRSDRRKEQPSGQLAVLKSKLERSEQQVTHQKQTMDELQRDLKRKDEELTVLNGNLTKVEEHKDMLLNEVSDLRKQLQKSGSVSVNETRDGKSELSSDERQQLEDAVAQLEERLQRLLAERDQKIEQLHRSLSDERQANKELRKLNKESNQEQRDNSFEKNKLTQNVKNHGEELKLLQNENKALRRNGLSPPRSTTPKGKGAISGLVASFERRIVAPKSPTNIGLENDHQCEDDTRKTFKIPSDQLPIHCNISDLEQELIAQKQSVFDLQQQLGGETKQVDDLRRELEEITDELLSTRADHRQKAQELVNEIENLQSRCKDLEVAKPLISQTERTKSEQHENLKLEASQLRLRVRDLEHERDGLNNKLFQVIQESDKRNADAKKEIEQLRGHLATQHTRLQRNEDNEEELIRLREQVKTMQPELHDAITKIDQLENLITDLKQALATSSSSDVTQTRELRKLVSELSVEKAQIEVQTSSRIRELECEIEVIESSAEAELEEKEKQICELQKTMEAQKLDVQRLEVERVELSYQVNGISISSKNEIEALKEQLMETSARASAQQHEIDSLKMKLEEKIREEEAVLVQRDRINELEDELQAIKRSIQSPVTDVDPLKQENTRLRDKIREIQKERRSLHERLDSILTDKSSSKSAQVLRDRNASLRSEVENLTQRLKKMEESITRCAV